MGRNLLKATAAGLGSLVAVALLSGLLFGPGTSAEPRWEVPEPALPFLPPDASEAETFYVVAYHWGWAIFTPEGQEVETIRVKEGTPVVLLVANALADQALARFPEAVVRAVEARNLRAQSEGAVQAQRQAGGGAPLWPFVEDHGFLIPGYGEAGYLDDEADRPLRVAFVARRQGEGGGLEFVCTNYCGPGHSFMAQIRLEVE